MIVSLGYVAVYVVLVGVASFIEGPAGRGLGAFQLNALIRAGSLAAGAAAFLGGQGDCASLRTMGLGWSRNRCHHGRGIICYCLSLDCTPVSLVATLSNLYLVITIVLGTVVLHEPVTALTAAGLASTLAGVLVLVHPPAKYAVHSTVSPEKALPVRAFGLMGLYIVLIGAGAFLEKPALRGLDATQLNGLQALAMTAVAGIALAVKGPRLPITRRTLGAIGIGALAGLASVFYFLGLRGLPVSIAAASSTRPSSSPSCSPPWCCTNL